MEACENKNRTRIEPCGTSQVSGADDELWLPIETQHSLSDLNHLKSARNIPTQ